ncbi:MAG: NUDIX domain-containing protein, partial [Verrucomicrobiota bacterium]|nr:NUDIX domain-containing protein [Verrucomicrobiota bacterium]
RWRVKYLRTLPGSVFYPAPKVDSAVVALTPRDPGELPECDGARFATLVKLGFSQRRKQLRKRLAGCALDWPRLTAALGVPETARAEELSLAQWIQLTNLAFPSGVETTPAAAQDVHGEIFDVVDERDLVIGQASRHEVHVRRLRHRAVHVFVFNRGGELFLQRRSRWKDVHPRLWDSSCAGHVNAGQSYDGTAARELVEELGVSASVERIGFIPASANTGWEFVQLYGAHHDGPFRLHPAEIESGGFFLLEQVRRWVAARPGDFASGFVECFRLWDSKSARAEV